MPAKPGAGEGRSTAAVVLTHVAVMLACTVLAAPALPAGEPNLLATLSGHTDEVTAVAFRPDGNILASGSLDGTIKLWDVATKRNLATLQIKDDEVYCVAFSPDGKTLASGSTEETIRLWDVPAAKNTAGLKGKDSPVHCVVFSPDGKTLASGTEGGTIALWEGATGRTIFTREQPGWVVSAAFTPDGKTLATADRCVGEIRLWDVRTGEKTRTLQASNRAIWAVAYSPDGKTLASGNHDKTVTLWDAATGKSITTFKGHEGTVYSVAYRPDGNILASGSGDKTIRLWDVASAKTVATLTGHAGGVQSVRFSPDGKMLASGSDDKTVKLWDVSALATPAGDQGKTGEDLVPVEIQLPKVITEDGPGVFEPKPRPTLEKHDWKPRAPLLAPRGVKNLAAGRSVTSSDKEPTIGELSMVTDGDKDAADGSFVELHEGRQWVQIDLGATADLYGILFWHYLSDRRRVYYDVIVQVSDDPDFRQGVRTLFNNDFDNSSGLGRGNDLEYVEDYQGRLVRVGSEKGRPIRARYVRLYSSGNTMNGYNHYVEVEVFGKPTP
jgi:Tol biopolymer transport system component